MLIVVERRETFHYYYPMGVHPPGDLTVTAEQAHHIPGKEKQSVPDGERPVVHIVIVCGFWQGASYSGAHPVFVLPLIF